MSRYYFLTITLPGGRKMYLSGVNNEELNLVHWHDFAARYVFQDVAEQALERLKKKAKRGEKGFLKLVKIEEQEFKKGKRVK